MSKATFYFDVCGVVNTEKTLQLALERARELEITKLVAASETGLSALKAVKQIEDAGIELIVVTSAAGTKIKDTIVGDLRIGIADERIWNQLKQKGVKLVRATDPLYNIGAALEEAGVPTVDTVIRQSLNLVSSGTAVCVSVTMMATDHGFLRIGEEVVAVAGSWLGLDTALVVRVANSVSFFEKGALQIKEIICKPRNSRYSWPINQKDWKGDVQPYEKFAE